MPSLTRSIAWNTILQIGSRAIGTLLGLIAVALLTRYLGTAGYGAFTTITGFLQFFGILVDFGLTLTAVQMIAEPNADESRIMGNIFTLRLVSALVFFGLAPIVALAFPYPVEIKIGIAIGSLAFFAMTQSQVLVGIFQKHLRMSRAAMAEVAGRLILLLGLALVVFYHWGLSGAVWALVAGNATQFTIAFASAERLVRFRLRYEPGFLRTIIHRSWPIGLSIAFNLIYLKGDVVILSLFRSQTEVGLYGAAYKVLDVVTVIPMMFMGLVLPILVTAWQAGDRAAFARRLQKAFDFSALLAFPLLGGTLIVGRRLMVLVAGAAFHGSGDLLPILIVAGAAVFFSGLYGHTMVAIGKQRSTVWSYAANAALALAGYLIFIPKFGAVAAAWVTVFSEVFIALTLFILSVRFTRLLPSLMTAAKATLATIFMMLILLALPTLPVLILVFLGAATYLIFLILLQAVSRDALRDLLPTREP